MPTKDLLEVDIRPSLDACYAFESSSVLDEKERVVSVVLITVGPGNTRDKNFYSQEAIQKAVPLFEGAKCFANHPSVFDQKNQPERRAQDILGYFSEVKVDGEKLIANLHIVPGENAEWAWPLIKESIKYSTQYPGKVLSGLSINARGAQEPMELQGEQWKKVTQFLEVRSVDLVTQPARGGRFGEVLQESVPSGWKGTVHAMLDHPEIDNPYALVNWMNDQGYTSHKASEREAVSSSATTIFTAIKEKVGELNSKSYPGMEDLRRQLDQLGTELNFNKAEEAMADKAKGKDGDIDFDQMGEAYKKMAEGTNDDVMKAMHMRTSEVYKAMGKAKASEAEQESEAKKKEAEAKKKEEEAKKKEAESKGKQSEEEKAKEAEAKKKEEEAKKESEYQVKYLDLKRETMLTEAGLSDDHKDFLKTTLLEGVTDENKMTEIITKYTKVQLKESAKRTPHNFEKNHGGSKTNKLTAAEKLSAAIS